MGNAPYRQRHEIERGVVYNPTIHHGFLLEKNRHPGRRQPWPRPPPIGPLRPFRSKACVDRAMGDAPYRRRQENLAGVDVLPTIHHGYLLEKNCHPVRRQPWPLPPLMGRPRPFRSKARVYRAMGDAPYHRRHENRAGGGIPTLHH